jgi:hypothetical protein
MPVTPQGRHRDHRVTGPALRAAWFERRAGADEQPAAAWRTPGVDAVVSAVIGQSATTAELERALRILAWERAADPGELSVLLADVEALWSVLTDTGLAPISPELGRDIAIDGWVDAVAAERGVPCIDPLSGLHTAGYLTGRIHELDRIGGPDDRPSLVMLVIGWDEPDGPWLRIATILQVVDALHAVVRPEATLAQDGAHTAIALVADDGTARMERAALQRRLDAEPLSAVSGRIDLVPVPDDRNHLPEVLRTLRAATARVGTPAKLRMRSGE